jgi:hypothetical protein
MASTSRVSSYVNFLISARRLATLQLVGSTTLQPSLRGEKLPPVKKLQMSRYDWTHSAEQILQIWDLSNLTTLAFEEGSPAQCRRFLLSLQPDCLPALERFSCTTNDDLDASKALKKLLARFIGNLRSLKKIAINFYDPRSLVQAIAESGHNLRTLKLMDPEFVREGHLNNNDFIKIAESCPKLSLLELDSSCQEAEASSTEIYIGLC